MNAQSPELMTDEEFRNSRPATFRCGLCPRRRDGSAPVIFKGRHDEGVEAARLHRVEHHPDAPEQSERRRSRARPCSRDGCDKASYGGKGKHSELCAEHRDDARRTEIEEKQRQREDALHERATHPVTPPAERNPRHLMTEERKDEIVRMYVDEKLSANEIAKRRYQEWGYKSQPSLCTSTYDVLKERNVERRSRGHANQVGVEQGYLKGPPRTQPILTEGRLAVAESLLRAECTLGMIGQEACQRWGYKNPQSLVVALGVKLRARGVNTGAGRQGQSPRIPLISRAEATALLEEAG